MLNQAAQAFVGKHDFTSFCTLDHRERDNMERTVKCCSVSREGSLVTFRVEADGFLYNMVRIMGRHSFENRPRENSGGWDSCHS